jgi:hypothetical protein
MNTHADKKEKQTQQGTANAVTVSNENTQPFQFKDNRPEAVIQQKMQDNITESTEVTQLQSTSFVNEPIQLVHQHATVMKKRRRFKRSLKTAINRIKAIRTHGPADEDQIKIHDAVLHSGQHHGMRNVSVQQLITDLTNKIEELTQLNLVDSDHP